MINNTFIFLAGLHRSGTSLLHEILREHPDISGFTNTAVQKDEGQHLQSVFKPAKAYGGPGKFVFHKFSYMNEYHPLVTEENAEKLLEQWSDYWDMSKRYLIEKSPSNIIRTRFLQKIFPKSKFIIILRHPLAVSYATQKWSRTSIFSLMKHTLLAYKIVKNDIEYLHSVIFIRYEDFVLDPQKYINKLYKFLGLRNNLITHNIHQNINQKYLEMWEKDQKILFGLKNLRIALRFEKKANLFGYSIKNSSELLSPFFA